MAGAQRARLGRAGSRRYIRLAVEASLRRLRDRLDRPVPVPRSRTASRRSTRRWPRSTSSCARARCATSGRSNFAAGRSPTPTGPRATRRPRAGSSARRTTTRCSTGRRGASSSRPASSYGVGHPAVLPARQRPAHRQVPPGRAGARGHPAGGNAAGRAAAHRPRRSTGSRRSRRSPPSAASRCSTWRSAGSPRSPRWPRSSPARPAPEQVQANAAAGPWEPTDDDLAAIDEIVPPGRL